MRLMTLLLVILSMSLLISAGPNKLSFSFAFDLDLYSQEAKAVALSEFVQGESLQPGRFILKAPYSETMQLKYINQNTLRFSYSSFQKDSLRDVCVALSKLTRKLNIFEEVEFPFTSKGNASVTLRVVINNFPQDKLSYLNEELERFKLMNAIELANRTVGPFTLDEVLFGKNSHSRGFFVDIEDLGNVRSVRGQIPIMEFRTSFYDTPDEAFKALEAIAQKANDPDPQLRPDTMINYLFKNQPELLDKLIRPENFLAASDEEAKTERFRIRFGKILRFYESKFVTRYPLIRQHYLKLIDDPRYNGLLQKIFGQSTRVSLGLEAYAKDNGQLGLRKRSTDQQKNCPDLFMAIILSK